MIKRKYMYFFRFSNMVISYILTLGLWEGIKVLFNIKIFKNEELTLNIYQHPLYIRNNKSDITLLQHIILGDEYGIPLKEDFNPQIIIDAGANIGLFSVYFKNKFETCKVFAIEPEKSNFEQLIKNTKNYQGVECLQVGIWDKHCFLKVVDENADKWRITLQEVDENNGLEAFTIDDLVSKYHLEQIDILKIDIEGAEKIVFESNCEGWLKKTKILIVETHDRYFPGCSKAIFRALDAFNFELFIKSDFLVFYNKDLY